MLARCFGGFGRPSTVIILRRFSPSLPKHCLNLASCQFFTTKLKFGKIKFIDPPNSSKS